MTLPMMTMTAHADEDGEICRWDAYVGGADFRILRNDRGDWETTIETRPSDVLDVSGDLSGSLEYIGSLFK
jgi:hypothetical protein